jgi:hypothetical protein
MCARKPIFLANTSPLRWGFVYPNDPGTVPPGQLAPYVWEFFTCDGLFVFSPTPVGVCRSEKVPAPHPPWGSVDLRLTHAPHPRGSLSAIARAY